MVPLRRRLFLLVAAAIVPLAAIAGMGLLVLVAQQRAQAQRAGIELTRALATAVDAELGRSLAVLQAMATSPTLDSGDLPTFLERATRVLDTERYWRAFSLIDADGTAVLHTRHPLGSPLRGPVQDASVARLRAARAPTVGGLAVDPDDGQAATPSFRVLVPVIRSDALRFIAVAFVDPEAIVEILRRQRVPHDWVISIFDDQGLRVARSRSHAELLGKPGAPSVVALMARPEPEGWGSTTAIEGDAIYTAYSRVNTVPWTVATGIPRALVDHAIWRSALIFGGGILLSIAVAALAALSLARGITGPMAALRRAAEALGRREPLAPPVTRIAEIREVGDALAAAADERLRGEQERETLLQSEQEARAAAEAANRAKDEFLAMLGHELRNPLGAIANASALLDQPRISAEIAARARSIIARQTSHLARLTDDLLDAARAISGKIVLHRQLLDLADTVGGALATLEAAARTADRRVVQDLRAVGVEADPTRIEQMVVNLVGNAVKYTSSGGTIHVRVGIEYGAAVLRVSDDGIGMSPELAAHAFDLFVQGNRSLDRAPGGLGVGLTLVRRLAELHGGSVSAHSDGDGQGSDICVRLPAAPLPARAAPVTEAPRTDSRRDVLIVEDNDDAREALRDLLELAGHDVRATCDGPSGIEAARDRPPEVVLVDVGLPGIDGYEVARRLRSHGGPRMTLVAVTGYGLPEDRERARRAGFDEHLVKPVDLAALRRVLAL